MLFHLLIKFQIDLFMIVRNEEFINFSYIGFFLLLLVFFFSIYLWVFLYKSDYFINQV